MDQEAFAIDDKQELPKVCGWCSNPAVDVIVVEKPRYRMDVKNGQRVRVMAKQAITAGVCRDHEHILAYQQMSDKDYYQIQ